MYLSRPIGKPTICIGENKDADQLRGNREADQRLCFRYTDSTIPLLPKCEISSFYLFFVTVQPDLCQTCSETTLLVFPRDGSFNTDFFHSQPYCPKVKREAALALSISNFVTFVLFATLDIRGNAHLFSSYEFYLFFSDALKYNSIERVA